MRTSTPEILKYNLVMLDMDGDRQADRGNTICPFYHSKNGGGIKKSPEYFLDLELSLSRMWPIHLLVSSICKFIATDKALFSSEKC